MVTGALLPSGNLCVGGVMSWILVLFIHAGVLSNTDSMAVTNIRGFSTEQACKEAGEKSRRLVSGTTKDVRFVCVAEK